MNDTSNIVSKNIQFGFPHHIETAEPLIFVNAKWSNLEKKDTGSVIYTTILKYISFQIVSKNNNGGFSPTAIRIKKKVTRPVLLPPSADETQKRAILTFNFFCLLKFLNFSVFYMLAKLLAYDHIKKAHYLVIYDTIQSRGYLIKKINYQIISVVSIQNAHIFGFLSG